MRHVELQYWSNGMPRVLERKGSDASRSVMTWHVLRKDDDLHLVFEWGEWERDGMTWHDMIWHDMTWHEIKLNDSDDTMVTVGYRCALYGGRIELSTRIVAGVYFASAPFGSHRWLSLQTKQKQAKRNTTPSSTSTVIDEHQALRNHHITVE